MNRNPRADPRQGSGGTYLGLLAELPAQLLQRLAALAAVARHAAGDKVLPAPGATQGDRVHVIHAQVARAATVPDHRQRDGWQVSQVGAAPLQGRGRGM